PSVYFVTQDHLGDADVHGDLVDIFDLVRAARARVWHEPVSATRLRAAGLQPEDPAQIASLLADEAFTPATRANQPLTRVDSPPDAAVLRFADGSSIVVPKRWSRRITDLEVSGTAAEALLYAHVSVAALRNGALAPPPRGAAGCAELENIEVNRVFYR